MKMGPPRKTMVLRGSKMKKESRYEPKSNDKDDLNEFLLIADELDNLI